MPKSFATVTALLVACLLLVAPAVRRPLAAPSGTGLTEGPRLAAAYDAILRGRSDEARQLLTHSCPPGPTAACDALRTVSIWWEIQQDLSSRALDERFNTAAAASIASATAWTAREPARGEAWFYLAGAYAPLAQWRILRGERLAAARDGKRIKDALERALALDPQLNDAWFGIGLYHYYADVVPAALKVLRFLLLMPGGDRVEGMREMLRTRERGELLRGEADFQMHWLYLWYENNPGQALELLKGLQTRYPTNPLFIQRTAEVAHVYFSDHQASADAWRTMLESATSGRIAFAALAAARARVGLAAELIELSQARQALDLVEPVVRTRPTAPYGIVALAELTRGDAFAALGARADAANAYTRALNEAQHEDADNVRGRARDALARTRSRR